MHTDTSSTTCPRCGAVVDTALAGGSCPACLLRAVALGTAADSLPALPWVPPSVAELASAFPQLEIIELIGHGQRWKPNGETSTEEGLPIRVRSSYSSGKIVRVMEVRVFSSTGERGCPQVRFPKDSGFGAFVGALHASKEPNRPLTLSQAFECPPEARTMSLEIGVADGNWKTALAFERYNDQRHFNRSYIGSRDGDWEGTVQIADPVSERYPVSFSFTHRDDAETRLVYELPDGKLVPLKHNAGLAGLRTGLTTIPVKEFDTIKQFHVQSRRYQWVEFRNVSLELGHVTEVEVSSAN